MKWIFAKTARAGFTLLEIMTVVSILGLLSTIGTVSYSSARATSRDTKRVTDMKSLQVALEIFRNENGFYPGDGQGGPAGLILGSGEALSLSDAGFARSPSGNVYMLRLPANADPGGLPYTYRSVDYEGNDCNTDRCASFAIVFALEKGHSDLLAGANAVTPDGFVRADAERAGVAGFGRIVGLESIQGQLAVYAGSAAEAISGIVESKAAGTAAEIGVAPAAAAAAALNVALAANASSGAAALGYQAILFLTQPTLLFSRRRRLWGTVYNSLSRLPEDLAIVRLRDAETGRSVRSDVTDRDGRYSFLAPPGRYRLEVRKAGFSFPSRLTAGLQEDGPYRDLYHGEELAVAPEMPSVVPSVPIDPEEAGLQSVQAARHSRWRSLQSAIAFLSPLFGLGALIVKPSVVTVSLAAFQVTLYVFFRRLVRSVRPKGWGTVRDDSTRRPVDRAVVRIFSLPYHKLLETKMTDRSGRYNFRVGSGRYYMTVERKGYLKTQTDEFDFSQAKEPMFVAADLPLRRQAEKSGL